MMNSAQYTITSKYDSAVLPKHQVPGQDNEDGKLNQATRAQWLPKRYRTVPAVFTANTSKHCILSRKAQHLGFLSLIK